MYRDGYQGLFGLLSLIMSIDGTNNQAYSNLMIMDNEKLMGYSISLVGEIDDLLSTGYSYDEIKEIIRKCDFKKNNSELTDEEVKYLRMEAYRLLDIRYEIYINDKKQEKVKKHLFNN